MTEDKIPENVLESIFIIENFSEFKMKEKGSQFIGQAFPISSEDEFTSIINNIRKTHYDATHHCYAYKLLNGKFKYSDDGEPSGTAGIRLFNAIEHYKLSNILVIAIRYFGGVKLGVGPLGKAYYYTADELLKSAVILEKKAYYNVEITLPHNLSKSIFHLTGKFNAKIRNTDYIDDKMVLIVQVPYNCKIFIDELNKFKPHLLYKITDNIDYL